MVEILNDVVFYLFIIVASGAVVARFMRYIVGSSANKKLYDKKGERVDVWDYSV